MPGYLDELKVKLSLEDTATPDLKKKTEELKKSVADTEAPLKNLLNLKNTLIAGALGGLAAFLLDASTKFIQLSRSVEQASLSFTDADKNVRDLTFRLQEMANTSIYSTEQLAQGLAQIKSTGLEAAQALGLLQVAQAFSAATGVDLSKSVELETVLMANFNMTAEEAAQSMLKISEASKITGVNSEFLTKSLQQLSPVAAAGGVSFEDLLSTLSSVEAGFKNPVASLSIIQSSLEAIGGNKEAEKTLKMLGVNLTIEEGKTTLADVVQNLIEVWGSLSPEEKIKKAGELQTVFSQSKQWNLVLAVKELLDLTEKGLEDIAKFKLESDALRESLSKPIRPIAPKALSSGEILGKQFESVQNNVGSWINDVLLGFQKNPAEGFARIGYGGLKVGESAGLWKVNEEVSKNYERAVTSQIKAIDYSVEAYKKHLLDLDAYYKKVAEAEGSLLTYKVTVDETSKKIEETTKKVNDIQTKETIPNTEKLNIKTKEYSDTLIKAVSEVSAAVKQADALRQSCQNYAASAQASANKASANVSTSLSGYKSVTR